VFQADPSERSVALELTGRCLSSRLFFYVGYFLRDESGHRLSGDNRECEEGIPTSNFLDFSLVMVLPGAVLFLMCPRNK